MIPLAKITDHAAQALGSLLSQFDASLRLRKLVEILAGEVQRWENWQWSIWLLLQLDNAVGWWLDLYGRLVGFPRLEAEGDDHYRTLIEAAIQAHNSHGLSHVVQRIASIVTGRPVQYRQEGPASFSLQYETDSGLSADAAGRLADLIKRAKRPGAHWSLIEGSHIDDVFRLNSGRLNSSRLGRIVAGSDIA